MNPLSQGLEPSCDDAERARGQSDQKTKPGKEHHNTHAENGAPDNNRDGGASPEGCWLRKKDTVIGIIGNTQGVNNDASPKPKAVSKKGK